MAHSVNRLESDAAVPLRLAAHRDVSFLADLARWMQASGFHRGRRLEGERAIRERIASGTLDGALWLLGVTDLPPVSHASFPRPTRAVVVRERDVAGELRYRYDRDDPEWLYLGGVLDMLEFALGVEAPFWWVPLPEKSRIGPPARDIYGREIP